MLDRLSAFVLGLALAMALDVAATGARERAEAFGSDVACAIRSLARAPGLAAVVIVTLGLALGCRAAAIVRRVVLGALGPAGVGVAAGLVLGAFGARLFANELYETTVLDPLTFASVATLVVGAALVAAVVPARRIARLDPLVALRYE